jgi:hypothetical protein
VNGGGFDAIQFTLYEPGGSWFDPHRPVRLVSSVLPRLSYQFSKHGRYLLEVGAFSGISGPDVVYLLRIAAKKNSRSDGGPTLADLPELQESGLEPIKRAFSRRLELDRMDVLAARTVAVPGAQPQAKLKTTLDPGAEPGAAANNAAADRPADGAHSIIRPSEGTPALELSGATVLEGVTDSPGKIDSYKLKLKSGHHLAFELETPEATLPEFNPLLRLLDPAGQEVFNNLWFRVGPVVESRLKSLQPKTIFNFDRDGEYTLQIRDLIPRFGKASFRYRILIRSQVPHVGDVQVKEDSINVQPGKSEKLTVTAALEEGYTGTVALAVENLPPGVQTFTSTEVPPDPEPLLDKGKMEQYVPKKQRVEILVVGAPDAAPTALPQMARLVARPVLQGVVGSPVWSREVPVMVVKPNAAEQSGK